MQRSSKRVTRKRQYMKRILIVEDLEFNRDLLVQLLEDNYEVLTAADGAEWHRDQPNANTRI